MLVIELAKLPPPTPARQETTSSVVYETPGSSTTAVAMVGTSSSGGADDRPVPATELRHGEGVGQPDERAQRRRQRGEQELAGRVDAEHRLGQEEHQHRPHAPDREADVLGEDREEQVAAGDRLAGGLPEVGVLGPPVVDPAPAGPAAGRRGCGRGARGRRRVAAAMPETVAAPRFPGVAAAVDSCSVVPHRALPRCGEAPGRRCAARRAERRRSPRVTASEDDARPAATWSRPGSRSPVR